MFRLQGGFLQRIAPPQVVDSRNFPVSIFTVLLFALVAAPAAEYFSYKSVIIVGEHRPSFLAEVNKGDIVGHLGLAFHCARVDFGISLTSRGAMLLLGSARAPNHWSGADLCVSPEGGFCREPPDAMAGGGCRCGGGHLHAGHRHVRHVLPHRRAHTGEDLERLRARQGGCNREEHAVLSPKVVWKRVVLEGGPFLAPTPCVHTSDCNRASPWFGLTSGRSFLVVRLGASGWLPGPCSGPARLGRA